MSSTKPRSLQTEGAEEVKHGVTQKHRIWVTNMSGMTDLLIKNFKKMELYVKIILLNDCVFQQQF